MKAALLGTIGCGPCPYINHLPKVMSPPCERVFVPRQRSEPVDVLGLSSTLTMALVNIRKAVW